MKEVYCATCEQSDWSPPSSFAVSVSESFVFVQSHCEVCHLTTACYKTFLLT